MPKKLSTKCKKEEENNAVSYWLIYGTHCNNVSNSMYIICFCLINRYLLSIFMELWEIWMQNGQMLRQFSSILSQMFGKS